MKADPSLTIFALRDELKGKTSGLDAWKNTLREREETTEEKNKQKGGYLSSSLVLLQ